MTWSTGATVEHPARVALGVIDEGIDGLAESNLWSLSDRELLGLRIAQQATRGPVARAGAGGDPGGRRPGCGGRGRRPRRPRSGCAGGAGCTTAQRSGRCNWPGRLDSALPVLREALAAGEISVEHARVVADAIRALPAAVDPVTRARGEALLVAEARQRNVAALGRLAARMLHVLDPDGAARLEREEAAREVNEDFTLIHRPTAGAGSAGSSPTRTARSSTPRWTCWPRPAPRRTPPPTPAPPGGRRRADALMDLVRIALRAQELPEPGGEPVTVTVITGPEHLQADNQSGSRTQTDPAAGGEDCAAGCGPAGQEADRPPAAHLEDGTPLSPETTRRLSCDGWLVAAIIDAHGAVLDIGRRSRIVPAPMRRAVIVRDGGCAFPGCGRPARWCQAHHIWHWTKGGPTKLDNLVLLCAHHHNVVHHHGWQVHLDHHRLPEFTPPPWIDPEQTPELPGDHPYTS